MKNIFKTIVVCSLALTVMMPMFVLAPQASAADQVDLWGEPGSKPLTDIGLSDRDPREITATVINSMLGFLGIIAVIIILWGGFEWMTAGGNDDQVGKAISQKFIEMAMLIHTGFVVNYREYVAYERLVLVRLAFRLYEAKIGKRPEQLQDLVDKKMLEREIIIDPLIIKPFIYRIGPDGNPLIYSLGRDMNDDGGVPRDWKAESGDIILLPLKNSISTEGRHKLNLISHE